MTNLLLANERPTNELPAISAVGLRKTYRAGSVDVDALRGVDIEISAGSFVALMGPSGAGKTTLLNCLSGLDDITAGSVSINGVVLHTLSDAARTRHRATSMGFIFQAFNLIPVLTAVENVELPLLLAGASARQARSAAEQTLSYVGLGDRQRHRPAELSGGQQQRVAVARAIAGSPEIVWADEPTGNLDAESADLVMDLLTGLQVDGVTIVLVTHSAEISQRASRRITVRDGHIAADEVVR
jgi:putative ABC transport system ATP-binding protein